MPNTQQWKKVVFCSNWEVGRCGFTGGCLTKRDYNPKSWQFFTMAICGAISKPSTEGSIISQAITKNDSVSTQFQVPAQPTGYKSALLLISCFSKSTGGGVFCWNVTAWMCERIPEQSSDWFNAAWEAKAFVCGDTLLFFPCCLICSDIETQYKQCNKKCEDAEEGEGFEEEEKEASGGVEEGTSSHSTSFHRQQQLKVVFFRCKAKTCPRFPAQQTDS